MHPSRRDAAERALGRALDLAAIGPTGVNPQVGCVVLDADGRPVGEGFHRGAGTPHAEVEALRQAGQAARGGIAVVTLEPCDHRGRTGPCTQALLAAGVAAVVIGALDPTAAGGGAQTLRRSGVEALRTTDPTLVDRAETLLDPWSRAHRFARPLVTWKVATTLDGRVAAADGSSRWITGPAARQAVHRLRAQHDTVLVGTGTVLADDPHLGVRDVPMPARPPTRAVMGHRTLPVTARVFDDSAPTLTLFTRDPRTALDRLWAGGSRRVLLEGGPRVAAAFLRAELIDDIVVHLAPALLGSGAPGVGRLGIGTVSDALRFDLQDVTVVGDDVQLRLRVRRPAVPRPAGSPAITPDTAEAVDVHRDR